MTSIQPTASMIRAQLSDRSVRRAFDAVTKDNVITEKEVARLFDAAGQDNWSVVGDDTTPREKKDLQTIRKLGAWLMETQPARQAYDVRLTALDDRVQLEWSDNDAGLRTNQSAVDKISIGGRASGVIACPPGAFCIGGPSTVSMKMGDETFRVHPKLDESSKSIATRLAAEIESAGYKTTLHTHAGRTQITVKPRPVPNLALENLTTDDRVSVAVQGNTALFSIDYNAGPAELGKVVGLKIGGKAYTAASKGKADPFQLLRPAIERDGYNVIETSLPSGQPSVRDIAWKITKAPSFIDRTYAAVSGTAKFYDAGKSPSGGAKTDGAWLQLDKSIVVEGKVTRQIYVGGKDRVSGDALSLNGRLELHKGPNGTAYVRLTGQSDLAKGEPSFDGSAFTTAKGKPAPTLSTYSPLVADAPTLIMVPDQGADTMFLGNHGGFTFVGVNPFHGFNGTAKIESATADDAKNVSWKIGNDHPSNSKGEALDKIGDEGSRTWWLDRDSKTLYRFASGGAPGLLDQKVALGDYNHIHLKKGGFFGTP